MAIGVTTIGIPNAGAKRRSTPSHLLLLEGRLSLIHWRISLCDIDFSARVSRLTAFQLMM
ncbi:hypothetical protein SIAM614_00742 [Stappia aggregata IAM 12614]|uniref:Uncharacterized protein n=1 Tax=Roseibium aggregatum (strain ATCC 25650 / DSM 13394 / JCM 20685 / NBRC 16684 / NCIMB 2208 / IAM 12614 / B1) TaxID=384765 RepID=A0P2S1_ROSAI|nr:hypothetical protein SIAM614_00742 [Stappia aggregata IAM 12614] [Roseibium aggregatum IAM 12614]